MQVLLLTTDLMLISTAHGLATRHGVELKIAGNPVQAAEASADALAIAIDLRTPALDIAALVPKLRERTNGNAPIIAFGPHVHTDALEAAASAGCDEVITRGQFERRFDALLDEIGGV